MLSVVGASALGAVFHQLFVQQSLTTTSTTVLGINFGFVEIVVGQRIDTELKRKMIF